MTSSSMCVRSSSGWCFFLCSIPASSFSWHSCFFFVRCCFFFLLRGSCSFVGSSFAFSFERRPAAFASRQRQQARVVEDSSMAAKNLNEEQQQPPVEEVVTDVKGFPGGPRDTSVSRDFENHIALRVWNGGERPELKLSSHGRKMTKFGRHAPEIEGLVAASGLSPLIAWAFHSFEQIHVDNVVNVLVELLEFSTAKAKAETIQCHDSYVRLLWLQDVYQMKTECWIYEHFSSVGSVLAAKDYDERRPRACRWTSGKALPTSTYRRRLGRLTPDIVC
ncbi:uncharacterized protein LOC114397190 [Glycine soja]|uniref:uncharacterized protein LOC114397190 n=1 Tax=Glycine soja TaxID=3848 RepID=UPI00103F7349|nr:uncharacterized protein LOC114397190 [Glycine soja]